MVMALTLATAQDAHAGMKCDPMQYSLQIIDEGRGSEPHGSVDEVRDPLFKEFVASVSHYVLTTMSPSGSAEKISDNGAPVQLLFVRRPLIGSASAGAALPGDGPPPEGARHLESPWVKLTIGPPESCYVRAVFIWSERQFLLDQAVMDGADVSPNEPLSVIETTQFQQWANEYAEAVIGEPSREVRVSAVARLSERIPPDVLWLFRHAWQSTLAPFYLGAERDLHATIERVAGAYTDLTIGVVDRFLESDSVEKRHDDILALRDIVPFDAYRFERLH